MDESGFGILTILFFLMKNLNSKLFVNFNFQERDKKDDTDTDVTMTSLDKSSKKKSTYNFFRDMAAMGASTST